MWLNPQTGVVYRQIAAIRAAHPHTSLPAVPSDECLAWLGLVPVMLMGPPAYDPLREDLTETAPIETEGSWVQMWQVTAAAPEAVAERLALRRADMTCTPRQARLALQQAGLLDAVTAWIASADATTQIEWEFALEVRRDWLPILACATALGLSEAQLDALFAQAATL